MRVLLGILLGVILYGCTSIGGCVCTSEGDPDGGVAADAGTE